MDLIREILLLAEESSAGSPWSARSVMDHGIEDVIEHIKLLQDAGYVDARFVGYVAAMVVRITHAGHEFMDASREKPMWEKAKEKTKMLGVPITISAVKAVLDHLISERIHTLK